MSAGAGWQVGNAVLWAALVGVFLVLNEALARRLPVSPEIFRKVAHLGTSALVVGSVLVGGLDHRFWIAIGLLFTVVLGIARLVHPLRSFSRPGETSVGEVVYGAGVALAALTPDPAVFSCAVLVLGLADPAAQVVGTAAPIRRWRTGKSFGGTLAFAVVAVAVVAIFLPPVVWLPVVVGAAIAELIGRRGWDNVTVPATVVLLATLLG